MSAPPIGHTAHPPIEVAPIGDLVDSASVRAAYRMANAGTLRRRIDLGVAIFALVGVSLLVQDHEGYDGPILPIAVVFVTQAVACALAIGLARWGRLHEHLPVLGACLASVLAATVVAQNVLLGLSPEIITVGLVSILACTAALLPWGWRAQLGVSVVAVLAFAGAEMAAFEDPLGVHAHVGLLTVAVATVVGALLLDRYRFAAFQRAAGLERVSRSNREEAEISAALVRVGHTLGSAVGHADVFDRVNGLIVDLLGCDWSATVTLDGERNVYRVTGMHGVGGATRESALALEFPEASLPLFREIAKGATVEIEDSSDTDLMPASFFDQFGVSSALAAPIVLGGEVVGAVTNGFRDRRGPFSRKHRRITAGIAQATAIAVENQRLFGDLERANRVKSDFVSTMSHELRTPVNVMLGFARVLEEGDAGPLSAEQREIVARIRRSGLQLGQLVDGILDLSKLESGGERMKLDWLDIDGFVSSLEEEFRPPADTSDLVLEWHNHLPGTRLLTEAPRLQTIVRHLVANAVKFTPAGRVRVEFAQSGPSLVVTVSDSGIGISAEEVENIFEEFHQVDGTDSRAFEGVGLGLHIVRRLVERLGGSIAVVSEPGSGSVFTVEIPAQFARGRGV